MTGEAMDIGEANFFLGSIARDTSYSLAVL